MTDYQVVALMVGIEVAGFTVARAHGSTDEDFDESASIRYAADILARAKEACPEGRSWWVCACGQENAIHLKTCPDCDASVPK